MSRGDRAQVSGNLSLSMRDNYEKLGVEAYYNKVGSTYRNPHYPGIRKCMFEWLNRWWQKEGQSFTVRDPVLMFDMACGSGECTIAFKEWWDIGCKLHESSKKTEQTLERPPFRKSQVTVLPLGPAAPTPYVIAADPYTAVAYYERTSLPCASQSFEDVSNGGLPPFPPGLTPLPRGNEEGTPSVLIEMVVCSFALHLIENPSLLFSLLWELSTKVRWLLVLAPHKRPEIKDSWGWSKWDLVNWQSCSMTVSRGELLFDRVHLRVYRSLNV